MAEATYQQGAIRREQGNNKLAVGSGGTLAVESGGTLTLESGSTMTIAGDQTVSGTQTVTGSVTFNSTSELKLPVQTLTSTQTATQLNNFGLTQVTGTTTGPVYTLAAPVAGIEKTISLTHSSSGVTHRAVVNSNTTGVSFDTTGGNQITFATSALRGVSLRGASATSWRIVGVYSGASIAAPRTT
jgi:hypothetical protein